jgi:hypothetical protein
VNNVAMIYPSDRDRRWHPSAFVDTATGEQYWDLYDAWGRGDAYEGVRIRSWAEARQRADQANEQDRLGNGP